MTVLAMDDPDEPDPAIQLRESPGAADAQARLEQAQARISDRYGDGPQRDVALRTAGDVLSGNDSLAAAGAGFAEAQDAARTAEARLVGALATENGTFRELADATGLDVDTIANVVQRDKVTILSKPGCVQCDATERALTKAGVDFVKVDVAENEQAYAIAQGLGYLQAPVVIGIDGEHFSGFRPDRLKAMATVSVGDESSEPDHEPPRTTTPDGPDI
jgi:glutaredoxin-like protein NrdH